MPIKKAFILGAGKGTRLHPLTQHLPKPLVPVFNRPMVELTMDHCIAHGIESFIINTHHLSSCWQKAFPRHSYRGCAIEFRHEPTLLETGGGLRNIQDWIGDEPILVYNGDIWTDLDLSQLIHSHLNEDSFATLALLPEGPSTVIAYNKNNSQIEDIRNLCGHSEGTHQFSGVYIISPEIIDLIPQEEKVSIIPAFIEAMKQKRLKGSVFNQAHWFDIGTPQMYLTLHQTAAAIKRDLITPRISETAQIHPSAHIDKSSFIGEGAEVQANAVIESSIIWHKTCISEKVHLKHSILCGDDLVSTLQG